MLQPNGQLPGTVLCSFMVLDYMTVDRSKLSMKQWGTVWEALRNLMAKMPADKRTVETLQFLAAPKESDPTWAWLVNLDEYKAMDKVLEEVYNVA